MYHDSEESYLKAKRLLKDRFGNPERVTAAYVNKALKWPNIPSEDAAALNQYSLFLLECMNTLNDLHYTNEMEHSMSMKVIVSKLPFKLRSKWRDTAYKIQKSTGARVKLADLTTFIEEQSDILNNSPFRDILDGAKPSARTKGKRENINGQHQRNFATKATNEDGSSSNSDASTKRSETLMKDASTSTFQQNSAHEQPCVYCKGDHVLDACKRLCHRSFEEKLRFLRPRGICFGCLKTGHMKRDCKG